MRSLVAFAIAAISIVALTAQTTSSAQGTPTDAAQPGAASSNTKQVTVPAGTEVLLQLKNAIDTKNARVGDGVYCQTSFPVTVDNVIAIPGGTYVKGEIVEVRRAGKIKGTAEVRFRFTTMIFPSGVTVDMPGTVHHDSGAANASVDDEGKIKADSQKGKDAGTIAKGTGIGAAGGAILTGSRAGVLGGAGLGSLAGLATVLMTRGQDVRIEPGASVKMLLQLPLTLDVVSVDPRRSQTEVVPRPTSSTRLPVPPVSTNPK
jgi:hypothetical protein